MIDLVIQNGMVVTPQGVFKTGIGVKNGIIVALGYENILPKAKEKIDAEGLHVLPGLIDEHVHFRDPGLTYKEDFESGSKAAAAGGVTTVIDMPNTVPPVATVNAFQEKKRIAKGRSYVDYGLYGVLVEENIEEIVNLVDAGVMGFKLFMGETTGYIRCPSWGILYEQFKKVRNSGLRIGAHAEDDVILQHFKAKLITKGRKDPRAHLESRPSFVEHMAIVRGIVLSKETGCPFHIFHLSTKNGIEEVIAAKKNGLSVTAEVLVSHLLLDDSEYEKLGNLIRLNPPIRPKEHQDALWGGIQKGWIDVIATDHAPHSIKEKTTYNVWDAACGFIGVETALPLMLSQVNKGRISLEHYSKLVSENPARIWKLFPQKGTIQVGSDADFVLVDLKREGTIEAKNLHSKNRLTPFNGWPVKGLPKYTILRGKIIMEEGVVLGTPSGKWVRPINSDSDGIHFL